MRSETPAKRRSRRREQSSPCGVRDSNAPVSQPPVSQRLNLWGDIGCRSKDPVFSPLQARQNRTSQTYVRIPADPPPSSGDLLPGVAPPPTPALVPASPRLALPRSEPSTCGEDAESDERLANHVTPTLGTELDAAREEFPGLAKCVRARAAPLTAHWAAGEEGSADRPARSVQAATVAALVSGGARRKGGGAGSQLCALRRQAHFCSIPAARAQSPPATSPNPSHPALLRGRGHPLAFPPSLRTGPRSPGPGRPLLDSGRKPELSVDSAAAQRALH